MSDANLHVVRDQLPRSIRARSLAAVLLVVVTGTLLSAWWRRWPDVAQLRDRNPVSTAFMDRERSVATSGLSPAWQWVPLSAISPHLVRAVLVAEDIGFFSHSGFAWDEIRLAAQDALLGGGPVRGASSVTQQLAKNLWLSGDRSLWRKSKEAVLAVELERALSKRRILELYLNVVAFGPGVFGAEAAARRYFDRPALFLTEHQGAMLAAGLSRPSVWNPAVHGDAYLERVALIERRMAAAEFLWAHILAP